MRIVNGLTKSAGSGRKKDDIFYMVSRRCGAGESSGTFPQCSDCSSCSVDVGTSWSSPLSLQCFSDLGRIVWEDYLDAEQGKERIAQKLRGIGLKSSGEECKQQAGLDYLSGRR